MNFLFLNSARRWGGNEKWVYLASTNLAKEHNVYFAYRTEAVGSKFDLEKYKLPFLNEFDFVTLRKLFSIIQKKRIDVIIASKPKDYVLGGIASKYFDIKNILRLGIVRELHNSWIKNLVYNKLADGIIVNAQCIKDVLLKSRFMNSQRIKVIYNGVNIVEIESHSEISETINKPFPFTISSLGELSERKNFDELLKGFAHFLQISNADNAGVILIGAGEKRKYLQQLCQQLGIASKVLFTGFLENPYPYLKMSDVYISTSKNEGLSNALLEAMYLKTAVITTAAGDADRIISHGKNGLLINGSQGTKEKIGEMLVDLYKNDQFRQKMAEEGRQTILHQFSVELMKNEIVNFCTELVKH